jgi:hypothetical protein
LRGSFLRVERRGEKPMKKTKSIHHVTFYSYPKLLFYFIAGGDPSEAMQETLGWIYLVASITVLVTIGLDFERNHAVFWGVVFALFFFLGRWLEDAKGFSFFGNIYGFFNGLDVRYSRGMGLAIAVLMSFPYMLMLLWARLQNRWRITHNEFEHSSWGRADDSLARGAKRVRSTYPDLLELLLAGAGTLIVYSATGRAELRRINNVPMLPLLRRKIDFILSATSVTPANEAIIDEEVESEIEEVGDGVSEDGEGQEREDPL